MKGEVRNPIVSWAICNFTCGFGLLYMLYTHLNELKEYLGKSDEELNPTKELIISLVCGFYVFFVIIKIGKLIQEAQIKAGIADAEDQGVMMLLFCFLCGFGYYKMQDELNKAWEAA